ncbi:hypothetical protein M501DRAFT_1018670 [Patellaria atrata CBS 101060]|uniref:SAP domain-containing protein n=1 Tax=Patellaria atrata CBS 101060 TaxID=1346257 RepID=A0A9P4VQR9_9PEZI|nr:hypothetical protein M501DRAFT_1018670 [Patellaria atrata CBS 101060]
MTDYSKSTVAQLRQLLKDRSIPSTGLTRKQQIIDKLEEVDHQQSAKEVEEKLTAAELPAEDKSDQADASQDSEVEQVAASDEISTRDNLDKEEEQKDPPVSQEDGGQDEAKDAWGALVESDKLTPAQDVKKTEQLAPLEPLTSQTPVPSHEEPVPIAEPARELSESQSVAHSKSQSRLNTDELVEDRRKRKRRSPSPVIEEEVVKKKLRQEEEHGGVVHLKEDRMETAVSSEEQADIPMTDTTNDTSKSEAEDDTPVVEGKDRTPIVSRKDDIPQPDEKKDIPITENIDDVPTTVSKDDVPPGDGKQDVPKTDNKSVPSPSSSKPDASTPSDTTKPTQPRRPSTNHGLAPLLAPPTIPPSQPTDRTVTPSLHPATTSLYIRNFKRPLQAHTLKSHLITLATPPGTNTPDPSLLHTFHLDPLRTHAFAAFTTLAAAARVRAALHDTIWPPERDRKPLWSDFVPAELVAKWIQIEEDALGTGSRQGKWWEVIYTPLASGSVEAVFKEVGGGKPPFKPSDEAADSKYGLGSPRIPGPNHAMKPGLEAEGESKELEPGLEAKEPPSRPFRALDALFPSTTAKPKLYYLPIGKEVAEKRLAAFKTESSRDWVAGRVTEEELRRYSFQEERIVDGGAHRNPGEGGGRGRGRGGWRGR